MTDLSTTKQTTNVRSGREYTQQTLLNGSVSLIETVMPDLVHVNSVTGQRNPNYRSQIRNGQNATTARNGVVHTFHKKPWFLGEKVVWSWSGAPRTHYVDRWDSLGYHYKGSPTSWSHSVPSSAWAKAENEAITNLVQKLRAAQTKFQGGTVLGELGDTIRGIKNPAQSLRRKYRSYTENVAKRARGVRVRRLSLRERAAEMVNIASDLWLEYSLGMKPLVHDTRDAISALQDIEDKNYRPIVRVTAFGEAEFLHSRVLGAYSTEARPGFKYDITKGGSCLVKYIAGVGGGASAVGYAAKQVGLHPSNWLPTAWELVPYSFVIDYFTNVGDIISAYSIGHSSVSWGCKTTRSVTWAETNNFKPILRGSATPVYGSYGSYYTYHDYVSPGAAYGSTTSFDRSSFTEVPVPSIEFNLPWSGTQWITLGALVGASSHIRQRYRV